MWPVIGHEWAVDLLSRSIETRLSHAYLLAGPAQVGKRTLAKAFAQALLCTGHDAPCGRCRACRLVQADRHPDVHLIMPGQERIKIETIRELEHALTLSPVEGRYRVCILCRFDQATVPAANALLKTLEEPPPTVTCILTANRAGSLLPTIVSRCQLVPLRPLPAGQIVAALEQRGIDAPRAHLLGHLAQGRVGWALAAAQDRRMLESRKQVLEGVIQAVQGSYSDRFAWAEKLSRNPEQVPTVLHILSSWWRDVLLLAAGSAIPVANVDHEDTLREWAFQYGVEISRAVLRSIRDTAWRLERNANMRLALEVLMLDLPASSQ